MYRVIISTLSARSRSFSLKAVLPIQFSAFLSFLSVVVRKSVYFKNMLPVVLNKMLSRQAVSVDCFVDVVVKE